MAHTFNLPVQQFCTIGQMHFTDGDTIIHLEHEISDHSWVYPFRIWHNGKIAFSSKRYRFFANEVNKYLDRGFLPCTEEGDVIPFTQYRPIYWV